jgi:virulence-associated protein VagC
MVIAKVFKHGESQVIQLPDDFRVEVDEVLLEKTPEGFLVIARDPWELFNEGAAKLSDDFLDIMENRKQSSPKQRDWTE